MLAKVVLDKNVIPFSLTISFDSFQKNYILFKKEKNLQALEIVYSELLPTFQKWKQLICSQNYYSDITIYTLLRLLEADDKTPGTLENKLNLLQKYFDFFSMTFLDVCNQAFCLHMNKKAYIPMYKYSKPKDLFYYIAKEIKMFIFSIIRKLINYQNKQDCIDLSCISVEDHYYDTYIDFDILKNLNDVEYSHYLYYLLTYNYPSKLDLNYNENFIKENLICQLTKMLPFNN